MIPTGNPIQETSSWLPVLSTQGWLTGMYAKVDRIFSYYITSQYSQTVHHKESVRSLQYRVKEHGSSPYDLKNAIENDINFILKDYVDMVDVNVSYQERTTGPEVDYTISISIVHQGYSWTSFKDVRVHDGKFQELVNINNTGGSLV